MPLQTHLSKNFQLHFMQTFLSSSREKRVALVRDKLSRDPIYWLFGEGVKVEENHDVPVVTNSLRMNRLRACPSIVCLVEPSASQSTKHIFGITWII